MYEMTALFNVYMFTVIIYNVQHVPKCFNNYFDVCMCCNLYFGMKGIIYMKIQILIKYSWMVYI